MNKIVNSDKESCWVCGVRFTTSNPPGPALMEEHHIVPRAFGGVDGPVALICDSHHAALHKIATRIKSRKSYLDLVPTATPAMLKKLAWLATAVVRAEKEVGNDPNKQVLIGLKLSRYQQQVVRRLQSVYGGSQSSILERGLVALFQKTFGSSK